MEIRTSGRGHIVVVTDGKGKVIRYPIRLSKFKEKPNFYQQGKKYLNLTPEINQPENIHKGIRSEFLKELLKKIRYSDSRKEKGKKYRLKKKGRVKKQ
ncbi:MAG: hypothetical protein JKX79_10255 [Labilibaculum sp.]|nr:hypothetical protein [Labilibaculum sp.]